MDGSKRATSNFLLNQVLIYAVLCCSIINAIRVFGAGIEGFLAIAFVLIRSVVPTCFQEKL